jgi:hypothetical protein
MTTTSTAPVRRRRIAPGVAAFLLALAPAATLDAAGGPGKASALHAPADTGGTEGTVAGMLRQYAEDYGSLSRFYSAPYSEVRRERLGRFFAGWRAAVDSLPFETLGTQDRVDAILFRNMLGHELKQLDISGARFREMLPLVPFAPRLIALEEERRALTPADPESTAALLNDAKKSLLETMARHDGPQGGGRGAVKRTVAYRASRALGEIRRMLAGWFGYRNGYDPEFSWWVRVPYAELDSLIGLYAAFINDRLVGIKADDRTTIIGDPIGREALLEELRYEMIPYTPDELVDIAGREMAWCEAEMLRASRELGFGDDWKKALEHVKNLHVPPGDQPRLIRDLAREATAFIDSLGLLTIPELAKETWRMEMLTPEEQLASPFFLGGETIQVAYPTAGMGHEQKMMSMRGNNIHFARATVHHELIPGHHLQGFMNQRYRPYRWVFGTPFWTEGWALYWEMLLWDKGFQRSPEDRVGMLFWRMHRCARIIFSLSFHLEKMTPQECIDFLVERVGHERDNAAAEVRRSFRGDYGPLYQCAYLLGGLQFRTLHRDLVDTGRMTDRLFHDSILRNGSIPVEMVRGILTGEGLRREYSPSWRFYDGRETDD